MAMFEPVKMMLPVGSTDPPLNPEGQEIAFENSLVTGLKRPTFDAVDGTNTTFPFGAKSPPEKPPARVVTLVQVPGKGYGFHTPTFIDVFGIATRFPERVKTPPENPLAPT